MSNKQSRDEPDRRTRIIFLGMQSDFSHPSLRALLAADMEICAVIMPATQSNEPELPALRRLEPPSRRRTLLPVYQSSVATSVRQLAWEHNIPVWEIQRLSDTIVLELIENYRPDLICVACFPLRIPSAVLAIPALSTLNVHPSLLPANRGPEPLFWTFRLGLERTGVTVHLVAEGLDTGDIIEQAEIKLAEGMTYGDLEVQAAKLGGDLLVKAVEALVQGQATRRPQDESQSTYYPFPSNQNGREDFVIYPEQWDAHHLYTFIVGIKDWSEPLTIVADAELTLVVEDVLDYSYKSHDLRLMTSERDVWPIRCKRGKVIVKGKVKPREIRKEEAK
jgi:methionyl-tRNA formyltransferase